MENAPRIYWNPYLSGVGLGLVLLTSFVVAGRGLGVSGAIDDLVNSALTASGFQALFGDWVFIEVLGLVVGAMASGALAGRMRRTVDHGPHISSRSRLFLAASGGVLVGFGSRFAHGCTSGQALSGGALMSVGSWIFMITVFATAYAFAGGLRRAWR
jgi:hypothetical protein